MCASSCAITDRSCSSESPVIAVTGRNTTGRNHPMTAGACSHMHSQYSMARAIPSRSCRSWQIASNLILDDSRLAAALRVRGAEILQPSED